MPLKETGNKVKKTVIFDKRDYDKLSKIAEENKEKDIKGLNSISNLVRDAIKKYLRPGDIDILARYTKKELINYFTIEEATLIAACFNATLYEPSIINPKVVLLGNVEDSITLEGYDTFYNVDKETILRKLIALSEFQCYIVIQMAFEFWDLPWKQRQGEEMEVQLKKIFMIVGE